MSLHASCCAVPPSCVPWLPLCSVVSTLTNGVVPCPTGMKTLQRYTNMQSLSNNRYTTGPCSTWKKLACNLWVLLKLWGQATENQSAKDANTELKPSTVNVMVFQLTQELPILAHHSKHNHV